MSAIDRAKAKAAELGSAGQQASGSFMTLNRSLEDLGLSAQKIQNINRYLRESNPQILQRQLAAVREELVRLGASAQEIDKITRELTEAQGEADKTRGKLGGIESALLALGASAAFSKLLSEMREYVAEAERMYNATKGLVEVSKNLGYNVGEATKAVQDTAKIGFMSMTESAQAYKTALAMGLDIEQTTTLIKAMADAAAYNRQAHYGWGQAIVVSMEGIKNGNSVLTDAVGVTKNLSVMQAEYARTIGTTAGKLTDAQKIQAAYNGFLRESEIFTGNAAVALSDYTGIVSSYNTAVQTLEVSLGESIKPLFAAFYEVLTPIIVSLAEWVTENKELVSGLFAAGVAVTGFAAAMGTLLGIINAIKFAMPVLEGALAGIGLTMGPVGWAIAAIGAVAAGLGMYTAHAREAAKAAEQVSEAQSKMNAQLERSPILRSANEVKQLQESEKELAALLEERIELQERLREAEASSVDNWDALPELDQLESKLEKIDEQLATLGHGSFEEATTNLRRMREEIDKSSVAMYQMNKAEYESLATRRSQIEDVDTLMNRYKALNSENKLTNEQNTELSETINALKKEYPDLTWEIDAQGRARIANIDVIEDQIGAERNMLEASSAAAKAQIENQIKVTEANKKAIEAQIKNYQALLEVISAVAGVSISGPEKSEIKSQFEGFVDPLAERSMANFINDNKDKVSEEIKTQLEGQKKQLEAANEAKKSMEKSLQNLSSGEFIKIDNSKNGDKQKKEKKGKSPEEIAREERKKAYDAELATIQYQADMYDWSAERQIAAYEKVRASHKQHLKETVDDARQLNLQIKRLGEDSARSRYEFSTEWISREERRMQDSYKTEEAIAKMKIDAWTRLRDKYKKDSEEYKKSDEQLYQARKQLVRAQFDASSDWIEAESRRMEEAGKSENEIAQMKVEAWRRVRDRYAKDSEFYKKADEQLYQARKSFVKDTQKVAEDLYKAQKTNIDKAKKAELDAIEERKKAALSDYDERIKAIDRLKQKEREGNDDADYETLLAEKRARLALLQSAVGPDGIRERDELAKEIERMQLEHNRDLRERNLDEQKQTLQDEKTEREKAFDKEKSDAEAKYDALIAAFSDFSGDVKSVESAISAFRINSNAETNKQILSDLDSFVAQYNAKMAAISRANSYDSELAEYNANKDAWTKAKSRNDAMEMSRLNARNIEIRSKYGIAQDTGKLPSFDVGGVVPGPVGQPMQAVIHGGEAIFNPMQLSKLFAMLNAPAPTLRYDRPAASAQTIVNHIDMSVNDAVFEDKADVETLYSERERVASRVRTSGVKSV